MTDEAISFQNCFEILQQKKVQKTRLNVIDFVNQNFLHRSYLEFCNHTMSIADKLLKNIMQNINWLIFIGEFGVRMRIMELGEILRILVKFGALLTVSLYKYFFFLVWLYGDAMDVNFKFLDKLEGSGEIRMIEWVIDHGLISKDI